jgi:hypothetical protein
MLFRGMESIRKLRENEKKIAFFKVSKQGQGETESEGCVF